MFGSVFDFIGVVIFLGFIFVVNVGFIEFFILKNIM